MAENVKNVHKVRDLETVRLLADPLKLDLLRAFAEKPATTKQVAAELQENITKLYRHVDALHDAGLLEIVGEQQKRGTVERTFRAVASHFEVDSALFMDDEATSASDTIRDVLRAGETEIIDALSHDGSVDDQILLRLRIKASPARIKKLRDLLQEWLKAAEDENDDEEGTVEAGAMIAFYTIKP
ncbi:MAG: helix-turn-helix domain-containing protein [Woeseia sp.]|nr:helix-turn-helix domain-containing protein [Woeseia sp.]